MISYVKLPLDTFFPGQTAKDEQLELCKKIDYIQFLCTSESTRYVSSHSAAVKLPISEKANGSVLL